MAVVGAGIAGVVSAAGTIGLIGVGLAGVGLAGIGLTGIGQRAHIAADVTGGILVIGVDVIAVAVLFGSVGDGAAVGRAFMPVVLTVGRPDSTIS